jgi:hypothetical protein
MNNQVKPGKPRHKSKTYQFSAALVAFGLAFLTMPEFAGLITGLVPAQYVGLVPIILGAIVGILREVTSEPIAGREPAPIEVENS